MSAALRMQLKATIAELDATLRAIKADLQRQIERVPYTADTTPELMRDPNGRYLLLDGLAAKANAVAALAMLEAGR